MLIASTAIAITGKYFATLALNVIYTVTAEIFPTVARFAKTLDRLIAKCIDAKQLTVLSFQNLKNVQIIFLRIYC